MALYFINPISYSEDGLTPETGYHNFSNLLLNINITEDSIIKVVSTEVNVVDNELIFPNYYIQIENYGKMFPKVIISDKIIFQDSFKIKGLNLIGFGNGKIQFNNIKSKVSYIDSCIIENICVECLESEKIHIRNNLFIADSYMNWFVYTNGIREFFVCNNDFYNLNQSPAIKMVGKTSTVRILNNIFLKVKYAVDALEVYG